MHSVPPSPDRRGDPRLGDPEISATLRAGERNLGLVPVLDVSDGGLFVEHPTPDLPFRSRISLQFSGGDDGLRLEGEVVHVCAVATVGGKRAGYGVQLIDPPSDLVARLAARTAESGAEPKAPKPPAAKVAKAEPKTVAERMAARRQAKERERKKKKKKAIVQAAPVRVPAVVAPESLPKLDKDSDRPLVLIVDDDVRVGLALGRILRIVGCRTTSVLTAGAGIEMMKKHAEDVAVVIVDVRLPDIDGGELTRAIKAIEPRVPVIAISGVYKTDDAERILTESGAAMYLHKPFEGPVICRAVLSLKDWRQKKAA